jgi:hypothetical protein
METRRILETVQRNRAYGGCSTCLSTRRGGVDRALLRCELESARIFAGDAPSWVSAPRNDARTDMCNEGKDFHRNDLRRSVVLTDDA